MWLNMDRLHTTITTPTDAAAGGNEWVHANTFTSLGRRGGGRREGSSSSGCRGHNRRVKLCRRPARSQPTRPPAWLLGLLLWRRATRSKGKPGVRRGKHATRSPASYFWLFLLVAVVCLCPCSEPTLTLLEKRRVLRRTGGGDFCGGAAVGAGSSYCRREGLRGAAAAAAPAAPAPGRGPIFIRPGALVGGRGAELRRQKRARGIC